MLHHIAKRVSEERFMRPTGGYYVSSFDVSDMSDSVPHDTILHIMEHFGADEVSDYVILRHTSRD